MLAKFIRWFGILLCVTLHQGSLTWSLVMEDHYLNTLHNLRPNVNVNLHQLSLGRNSNCHQVQTCVCEYPNGQGINLTSLNIQGFTFDDKERNSSFYFDPCRGLEEPSVCPGIGTSICVMKNGTFTSLGLISETSFLAYGFEDVSLLFSHGQIQTKIRLECSGSSQSNSSFSYSKQPYSDNNYEFVLKSPAACIRWLSTYGTGSENEGLSIGSVLVIIFLVFGSVYFFGGSAANHLLQGATGWEMIPNREFWLDLPKLCLDGFRFMMNGFTVPPSYEQI